MALTTILLSPGDGAGLIGPVTRASGTVSSVIGVEIVNVNRLSSGSLTSVMSYEDDFDSIFTLSTAFSGYDLVIDSISVAVSTVSVSLFATRNLLVSASSVALSTNTASIFVSRLVNNDPFVVGVSSSNVSLNATRALSVNEFAIGIFTSNNSLLTSRNIVAEPFDIGVSTNNSSLLVDRKLNSDVFGVDFSTQNTSLTVSRLLSQDFFAITFGVSDASVLVSRLLSNDLFTVGVAQEPVDFTITTVSYVYPLASEVRFGVLFGPEGAQEYGTFIGFDQTEITSGRSTIRLGKNVTLLR